MASVDLQESAFEAIEPAGRLAQLVAYWRHLVPSGLPGRQHLDPVMIGSALLPHVFLADVLDGGERFRWRLIGTHIVNHAASDDTGRNLDATIAPAMRETIIGHYRETVRTGARSATAANSSGATAGSTGTTACCCRWRRTATSSTWSSAAPSSGAFPTSSSRPPAARRLGS